MRLPDAFAESLRQISPTRHVRSDVLALDNASLAPAPKWVGYIHNRVRSPTCMQLCVDT